MRKLLSILPLVLSVLFVSQVSFVSSASPVNSMLASNGSELMVYDKDPPYPLPDGVIAVEYLQGDGASGILIPWNMSEQYGTISLAYYNTDVSRTSVVFGQRNLNGSNSDSFSMGHERNKNTLFRQFCKYFVTPYQKYSAWYSAPESEQLTNLFTFSLDIGTKTATWYDGTEPILLEKKFPASSNLGIFGLANAAGNGFYSYGVVRLLFFKIEQDGVLVYNLIPVRFLNEYGIWEGAMYDLVSESLFLNQGTGSFIVGPDL